MIKYIYIRYGPKMSEVSCIKTLQTTVLPANSDSDTKLSGTCYQ